MTTQTPAQIRMANARAAKVSRQGASVEEHDLAPVGRVDSEEIFAARNEGLMVTSRDQRDSEGGPVVTEHTRPGTIVMYKPTAKGYSPRTVSVSAIRQLLRQGWSEYCPDCGGEHLNRDGKVSTDPNLCNARDAVAVRECPECGKRIYDNQTPPAKPRADGYVDPNVIQDEEYFSTTPEQRTRASLDIHMWVRHPRAAQMRGLAPLPTAFADLVQEQRPI